MSAAMTAATWPVAIVGSSNIGSDLMRRLVGGR